MNKKEEIYELKKEVGELQRVLVENAYNDLIVETKELFYEALRGHESVLETTERFKRAKNIIVGGSAYLL